MSRSTKIVMFDIDGVLADFILGFTKLARNLHDDVIIPLTHTEDQPSWDGFPGMGPREINKTWDVLKKDFGFWQDLPSLVSEREFRRILNLDADLYFVTSRVGVSAKFQTELWLQSHGIHRPTVIVTPDKGEAARIIGATHAIEDKAGNAVAIQYMSDAKSFIIDRPYNRFDHSVIGTKVQRVTTVSEFLNQVEAA